LREKSNAAARATTTLTIAIGGAATATIERMKKPIAIASVTKEGSARARPPAATLDMVQRTPVDAR